MHISKHTVVAIDFETVETQNDGTFAASLEFYRPAFRASSCAIAWRNGDQVETRYLQGESAIARTLAHLADLQCLIIAHNQQFDYGVAICRFPDISLNWHADTMRLCQLYDNGGDKYAPAPIDMDDLDGTEDEDAVVRNPIHGLSLSACVKRILCDFTDHKEAAYEVLRGLGVPAGQEKTSLHLLPPADMEAYNVADAVLALRLYDMITVEFRSQEYDWSVDNMLFQFMMKQMVRARISGIHVDRVLLSASDTAIAKEIDDIRAAFTKEMGEHIKIVERRLLDKRLSEYKTEPGQRKYLESGKWREECKFNPQSTTQLAMLFVDTLGIQPKLRTKKKRPSFKSSHLHQWGSGGIILQRLKKRGIVLTQVRSLLDLSEYDGLWHLDIKLCGTSTGRMAGGSH